MGWWWGFEAGEWGFRAKVGMGMRVRLGARVEVGVTATESTP